MLIGHIVLLLIHCIVVVMLIGYIVLLLIHCILYCAGHAVAATLCWLDIFVLLLLLLLHRIVLLSCIACE